MTNAQHFAQDWEAAWNSHDLTRIMAHYTDDVTFRSAKAAALVGEGEIRGKAALRDYWSKALTRQPDLRFEVLEVFGGHNMVTLLYVNQRGIRATETLWFNADGQAFMAAACHAG